MSEIKIPLSNTKLSFLLIGCAGFMIAGVWGFLEPGKFASFLYPEDLVFKSGIAAVLFFGLCFFFIAKKAIKGKTGLTINDDGIIDNSNATSIGLIEWKDIVGLETIQVKIPVHGAISNVKSPKMIIIKTNDPEKYIKRAKNIIAKKAMEANNKMYGSPLTIISNSLKIKFPDLEKLISEQMELRKK